MKNWLTGIIMILTICLNSSNAQNSVSTGAHALENRKEMALSKNGEFIKIKAPDGTETRAYVAGPVNAKAGILYIHDFFGITDAVKTAVDHLGALGYRTIAVDLYQGKSATTNDSASVLMQSKKSDVTDRILQSGIDYIKRPGRKLATIGFSAGGVDAMNANLMDPESFSGTIIVYGGGYDKIEPSRISKLKSPVLAITGALDEWPVKAAFNFFETQKGKSFEMYIYPGADHGYAQPLFNAGKNYDAEATRVTWKLMEDFLARHLNSISESK